MKKWILLVVSLTVFLANFFARAESYQLNSDIYSGTKVEFLKFHQPGPWGSYLQMNLPHAPMIDLLSQVSKKENVQLKTRGEAHITVVTPVEYWQVLRTANVTMGEIEAIAEEREIQASRFEVVCLGQGSLQIANKLEKTFFVVVKSDDLIRLREEIQRLFISKGGDKALFQPGNFYPHITLGFTERDLHESDGVFKDQRSCKSKIEIVR